MSAADGLYDLRFDDLFHPLVGSISRTGACPEYEGLSYAMRKLEQEGPDMSRYGIGMIGGIAMTAISGMLLIWWLIANTNTDYVGFLWIIGILVGIAVFAGSAAEAMRSPDHKKS